MLTSLRLPSIRRRRLLEPDQPKRILLDVLGQELVRKEARLAGFVVMPDHVHAVTRFAATGQLSKFMHAWKRASSFHIRNWYCQKAARYFTEFGEGKHFWQPKYFSFEIYEPTKLLQKIEYMHANPVRAGLVERATDWAWSSARWYAGGQSVGVSITRVD